MGVGVLAGVREVASHRTLFRVEKWDADQIRWTRRKLDLPRHAEPGARQFAVARVRPFDVYEKDNCNLVLNAGWQMIMNGIAGSAVTKFASGTGRIGGGISATAPAATQTDLQAATGTTNRCWEVLNATPTVGSTGAAGLILAATFPTGDGNFAWAEFGVDSGTAQNSTASVAPMLNRGTASPGTKTSAQTWNVTVTISWT